MVSVDSEKCIGCGACVSVCPEGFEIRDDGKAHVKDGKAECIKEAIKNCPVDAIKA